MASKQSVRVAKKTEEKELEEDPNITYARNAFRKVGRLSAPYLQMKLKVSYREAMDIIQRVVSEEVVQHN